MYSIQTLSLFYSSQYPKLTTKKASLSLAPPSSPLTNTPFCSKCRDDRKKVVLNPGRRKEVLAIVKVYVHYNVSTKGGASERCPAMVR
jgi:hypothetical protein